MPLASLSLGLIPGLSQMNGELRQDSKRLSVSFESPRVMLQCQGVQGLFAEVSKRRMPEVVSETCCLHDFWAYP
jgi:hypothetical protein